MLGTAKSAARDVTQHAKDAAAEVAEDARQKAADVRDQASTAVDQAQDVVSDDAPDRSYAEDVNDAPDRSREARRRFDHGVVPDAVEQSTTASGRASTRRSVIATTAIGSSTPHTTCSGDGCVSMAPV